jgi:ABC-type bacteriocin/lantibiotic exporter with double-glycine peptidase domain
MAKLDVPYMQQSSGNTCMAAALSAAYSYYGFKRTEEEIWQERRSKRLEGKGDFMLNEAAVIDAQENGFDAQLLQINLTNLSEVKSFLKDLKSQKIPVIICHQYSKNMPKLGHARIITDVTNTSIYLHDPDKIIGGAHQRWDWTTFIELWKKSGREVTGGVMIVIKKKK